MITNQFSENIRVQEDDGVNRKNRNDVANIYKNFLSDIKIYYNEKYIEFLDSLQLDPNNSLINLPLFPIIVREFIDLQFDTSLIEVFRQDYYNETKEEILDKMYFTVAAFLHPKAMLSLFEINKKQIVDQIKSSEENTRIISKIRGFKSVKKLADVLRQEYKVQDGEDVREIDFESKVILKLIKNDFLGYLKKKSLEIRKLRVLEIHRYLYRFSFVKT